MHRLRHARILWVFCLYWASCSLEHLCSSQSAQSAQCAQASLVGRSSALLGISSGSSSTSTYSLRLESAQARSNKCDDPLDPFADLCQDFGNMVKVVQLLVSTCSSSRSPRPRLVLKIGHRIVLRARTANQLLEQVGLAKSDLQPLRTHCFRTSCPGYTCFADIARQYLSAPASRAKRR